VQREPCRVLSVEASVELVVNGVGASRLHLEQELPRTRLPDGFVDHGEDLRSTVCTCHHGVCHVGCNLRPSPTIPGIGDMPWAAYSGARPAPCGSGVDAGEEPRLSLLVVGLPYEEVIW